jgi:hypothetical protein
MGSGFQSLWLLAIFFQNTSQKNNNIISALRTNRLIADMIIKAKMPLFLYDESTNGKIPD